MRKLFLILCLLLALPCKAALRVVNYNTAGGPRADMDVVLEAIGNESFNGIAKPCDLLFLQEQSSMSTTTQAIVEVLNSIYGPGTYARSVLNGQSGGAGRPGMVYNTNTIQLLEEIQINTVSPSGAARSTMRYKCKPAGYNSNEAVFYVYNSHYKASNDSTNRSRRNVEATEIRTNADALGQGVHIIYTGDMNIYYNTEPAFQTLLSSGNGQAFDPIDRSGYWHNNSAYTDVHTQNPAGDGFVGGGMDDRFDFQLITSEFSDNEGLSYITGSYRAFGNNDTHDFNGEITSGTGASPTVLAALAATSDHLPVVADYQIPAKMSVSVGDIPNEVLSGSAVTVTVDIENTAPVITANGADELDYELSTTGAVSGSTVSTAEPLAGSNMHTVTLDTTATGQKSGQILVTSNSQGVADGNFSQSISYDVVETLTGDFNLNDIIDANDIDMMFVAIGGGDMLYDLDGDVDVDEDDLDFLIFNILETVYGDADLDKKVDSSDLEIYAANWLSDSGWSSGDMTGDGNINFLDFAILSWNWREGTE